jgi:chemotaxis protein CheX
METQQGSMLRGIDVDVDLFGAIIEATEVGLQMSQIVPRPVGCSVLTSARHEVTVLVGLAGRHSGNLAINMSHEAMLYIAGNFIGEPQQEISDENVDAIMEIGNMVAGSVKTRLLNTNHHIEAISLPSLVLGRSHNMMYARGIEAVSVQFEIKEMALRIMDCRYFTTTISLLKGAGSGT